MQFEPQVEYERNSVMPELSATEPLAVWNAYFAAHRPQPIVIRNWVLKLHQEKQHAQVSAALQAALLAGQAQPWMYEVLALSMEIQGAPKSDVERVAQSMIDFGIVDFGTMMYSGAYLARFGRPAAALNMYRQASRMLPEQAEPYVLGLEQAVAVKSPEDIQWAAVGVLNYSWGPEYESQQRRAENALLEEERRLRKAGDAAGADKVQTALRQAKMRDLSIRVEWTGDGDLDLAVEEPGGGICSVVTPLTSGGGQHLHDGLGPRAEDAYELYICPLGQPGPYRLTIRNKGGNIVGQRAQVTITMGSGDAARQRVVKTVTLTENVATLTVDLPRGRRQTLRQLSQLFRPSLGDLARVDILNARGAADAGNARARQLIEEFNDSRQPNGTRPRRAGALIYAPVVQVIPEGATLGVTGVVSADRRYVRINAQPNFTNITDVFTFSYLRTGQ